MPLSSDLMYFNSIRNAYISPEFIGSKILFIIECYASFVILTRFDPLTLHGALLIAILSDLYHTCVLSGRPVYGNKDYDIAIHKPSFIVFIYKLYIILQFVLFVKRILQEIRICMCQMTRH